MKCSIITHANHASGNDVLPTYSTILKLFLVPQLFKIIQNFDANARATDLGIGQDHLVDISKVGCFGDPMLFSDFIDLDSEPEIDLVEADVGRLVLTGGGLAHGEQGALGHGRHRVGCYVALRAGTDRPCARRIVLFKQIADAIPISDCARLFVRRGVGRSGPLED